METLTNAKEIFNALDHKAARTRPNQNSHVFAIRARDAIAAAYEMRGGKYQLRINIREERATKANTLIAMGVEEIIYGAGRSLLRY